MALPSATFSLLKKIDRRTIVWLLTLVVLTLLAANIALWMGRSNASPPVALGVIRDPVVLAIVGAVLTFLVVDRWRRLEGEISELRQSQASSLSEIRDDAKALAQGQMEGVTRKAQAIENRIENLLEDHPWIADVTENEFLPDASSCRIVLRTVEELLSKGKVPLAYEYLFSWAKGGGRNGWSLEGTAEDFLALARFCEQEFGDEYLAYLVLAQGQRNALNGALLLPQFVRSSIWHGDADGTRIAVKSLRAQVAPSPWHRFVWKLRRRSSYRGAGFVFDGLTALAIFDAVSGDQESSETLLTAAERYAAPMRAESEVLHARAEICVLRGDYEKAEKLLDGRPSAHQGPDSIFKTAKLYRSLGLVEKTRALLPQSGARIRIKPLARQVPSVATSLTDRDTSAVSEEQRQSTATPASVEEQREVHRGDDEPSRSR